MNDGGFEQDRADIRRREFEFRLLEIDTCMIKKIYRHRKIDHMLLVLACIAEGLSFFSLLFIHR